MKKAIIIILMFLFISACSYEQPTCSTCNQDIQILSRIIDGDTFELSDGSKIRVLGIDYPDISKDRIAKWIEMDLDERNVKKCYYEGIEWMKQYEGKDVSLIQDDDEMNTDKYGRKLRYVLINEGDIGYSLIQKGYAVTYDPTSPFCSFCEKYYSMEIAVRNNKSGCLWNDTL